MSVGNVTIEARIRKGDLSLFEPIPSQTMPMDRLSLLHLQSRVACGQGHYGYLEVGSHLGGSLQPHLLDRRCVRIYSIDKRPLIQPDARRGECRYDDNSTQRMLDLLAGLNSEQVKKVVCMDGTTDSLDPSAIREAPDLCFIDGEHTASAVVNDFEFCMKVAAPDVWIVFHDATIVAEGLLKIVGQLKASQVNWSARKLPGTIFCVAVSRDRREASRMLNGLGGMSGLGFLALCRLFAFYRRGMGGGVKRVLRPIARFVYRMVTGESHW